MKTSLLGKARIIESGWLKFVARTSTGLPAIQEERSIDWYMPVLNPISIRLCSLPTF